MKMEGWRAGMNTGGKQEGRQASRQMGRQVVQTGLHILSNIHVDRQEEKSGDAWPEYGKMII